MLEQAPSAAANLSLTIQQHLSDLPQSERRLADLILEAPGQLASYSASEITRMAGVSNATMTRLVQRLGYSSYDQMRRLSREGADWGSPLFLLDQLPKNTNRPGAMAAPHVEASNQNILNTFSRISDDTLHVIGAEIAKARRVFIYGERNSHFFAAYLRWQIIQFRSDVILLPSAGETTAEFLASADKRDVAIVFGLRRRTPRLPTLLTLMHDLGMKLLLITDFSSRAELPATWHLQCDTRSPIPLDNHAAVMTLCHALSAEVIEHTGVEGRRHLSNIEKLHLTLKEL